MTLAIWLNINWVVSLTHTDTTSFMINDHGAYIGSSISNKDNELFVKTKVEIDPYEIDDLILLLGDV